MHAGFVVERLPTVMHYTSCPPQPCSISTHQHLIIAQPTWRLSAAPVSFQSSTVGPAATATMSYGRPRVGAHATSATGLPP